MNNMDQINPTVASWTPVEFLKGWVQLKEFSFVWLKKLHAKVFK